MNAVLKNMEAIFLVALALAGATNYAVASVPAAKATQVSIEGAQTAVVTISAKRA